MFGKVQTKATSGDDMAEPTNYDKNFDFSDWQATKPDTPLPGDQLDVELQNIETALGETQTALRDIRRSDGQLNNDIVTTDSISEAAFTALGVAATPDEDVIAVAENIDSVRTAAEGHVTFFDFSVDNTPAENTTAVSAMAASPGYVYDLLGLVYPVTAVPDAPRFTNGGWLVAGAPDTIFPAEGTVDVRMQQVSRGDSQYEIGSQGAVANRGRGEDVTVCAVVHKGPTHYGAGTRPHVFARGRDEALFQDEGPMALPSSTSEYLSCFALGCHGSAMFAGIRASGGAAETDKLFYRRVGEKRFNQEIEFTTTNGSAIVSARLVGNKHWDVRPGDYVILSDVGASINNVIINGLANGGLGYPVISHDPSTRTITFEATGFDSGTTADADGSETRTTPEIEFTETDWTPILTVETGTDYTLLHGMVLFLDGADLVGQSGVHGTGAIGCEFLRFTGLFATAALDATGYTLGGETSETLVEPLAIQLSTGAQVVSARTQDSSTIAAQVGYSADGDPSNATTYDLAVAFDKSPVAIAADEANDWLYFIVTGERDAGLSDPARVPVYVIQQRLSDFISNGFSGEYWQIGAVYYASQNAVTSSNGVGVPAAVVDDGALHIFLTTEQQNRNGDEDGRPRVQSWEVAVGANGIVGAKLAERAEQPMYAPHILGLGRYKDGVTIDVGGRFATIADALAEVSYYRPGVAPGGFLANINILTGTTISEELRLSGVDMSWARIVAEDASVTVDRSALTTAADVDPLDASGAANYPFILGENGAYLPRIGCQFSMDTSGTASGRDGILLLTGARAIIEADCGVNDAGGQGIYGFRHGGVWMPGASFQNAGNGWSGNGRGAWLRSGGFVNADRAVFDDATWTGFQADSTPFSAKYVQCHDCGRYGFRARSCSGSAENMDVQRSAGHGVNLNEGASVDLANATITRCGETNSEPAVLVESGSTADLDGATVSGQYDGVIEARGGFIDGVPASIDASAASGFGNSDLRVVRGGRISGRGLYAAGFTANILYNSPCAAGELLDDGSPTGAATISSAEITITHAVTAIAEESGSLRTVETVNFPSSEVPDGTEVTFFAADNGAPITLSGGTGNILTHNNDDLVIDNADAGSNYVVTFIKRNAGGFDRLYEKGYHNR